MSGAMTGWAALDDELARWRDDGNIARFWWRDDDAVRATEPLDQLLTLSRQLYAPLSLAVIPGLADQSLVQILNQSGEISILQHGFRHVNHAATGDKKSELGHHRPLLVVMDEVNNGRALMENLFGRETLPVLVPPWNRIDDAVIAQLSKFGFRGISRFRARRKPQAAPGLTEANTHVDIIDWGGSRGFRGTNADLDDLCNHLAARRTGDADATEPTGILTHHLAHDEACWAFMEMLLKRTTACANAIWAPADEIFPLHAGLQWTP